MTLQSPIDDRLNYPEDHLRARIASALGGRAAEELVYGVVTTGAENDLQHVSGIARDMVERWGMGRGVGLRRVAGEPDARGIDGALRLSEETRRLIDHEIDAIVAQGYATAQCLLRRHRPQLDALA